MTLYQSILLGIVQGLTEFIPVSSSGHLVIVPYLLGWEIPIGDSFAFDVLVQVATLAGVFAYFRKDLTEVLAAFFRGLWRRRPFADPLSRLGWYLILSTVPAGIFGLAAKNLVQTAFDSPLATAFFLILTAALLVIVERNGKRRKCSLDCMTWKDAWWIGVFQALAIFPGISRSGATITGGMVVNLDRQAAARFSFLMSIPIMLAAGLLTSIDLLQMPDLLSRLPVLLPGLAAAAITGYLSIRWLLSYLVHHPLYIFAAYCAALSLITLGVYLL